VISTPAASSALPTSRLAVRSAARSAAPAGDAFRTVPRPALILHGRREAG
jgi:hypothetical protein